MPDALLPDLPWRELQTPHVRVLMRRRQTLGARPTVFTLGPCPSAAWPGQPSRGPAASRRPEEPCEPQGLRSLTARDSGGLGQFR